MLFQMNGDSKNAENHRLFKIKKKSFCKVKIPVLHLRSLFLHSSSTLKRKKIFIKYAINLILQFIFLLLNIFSSLNGFGLHAYPKMGLYREFSIIFFHSSHSKKN